MTKLPCWSTDASELVAVTAMGVWEAVLAGGGRRFIKRKDSDAGETGRALEELRSSLYNEMHSSEGAKRQQQRFCGPSIALTFNFAVAVGIIMANKMVMGSVGFKFPIALSLIHYAVAFVLMATLKALSLLPVAPPSKSTPFSSIFALGAVMSLSTGLANVSLKHNSVGFYQMAKIAVTPTIVVAEFMLFQKKVSSQKAVTLAVVSFGVAVATVTDLEFNFFGACVALAWIVPSAVNKILWSSLQQSGNWTALALMWKTTPITIFFLLTLMPLLDPPGLLLFNWNFRNSCAIIISALFGFLLQWSGALALGFNLSPVTCPNWSRILNRDLTSSWTGFRKMQASSTYKDSLRAAFRPHSGDSVPFDVACSRRLCRVSMARMKRSGDNGSP